MEHDQHRGGEKPEEPERQEVPRPSPRIYVASLADYVDGRLHGAWLDVSGDVEELEREIAAMLAASPLPGAEEWAIHDYEGFGPLRLGEYESLAVVAALAEGIDRHGAAFAHWVALHGRLEDAPLEEFEQVYLGHWDSLSALADELWDDMGYQQAIDAALPESLQPYVKFDAEAYGRDLELGGDVMTSEGDGGTYVFGAP
jgi:antirestriction protein